MAITEHRRQLLESAIARLRTLAAQERGRMGAAGREYQFSSTALKNANTHDRQAAVLQAELDAGAAD